MTYELAKELKDAGFPQGCLPFFCDGCKKAQHNDEGIDMCDCEVNKYTQTYIPTLSELIEACGEHFGTLTRNGSTWYASHYEFIDVYEYGPTPDEAVARLWLALNRKEV